MRPEPTFYLTVRENFCRYLQREVSQVYVLLMLPVSQLQVQLAYENN